MTDGRDVTADRRVNRPGGGADIVSRDWLVRPGRVMRQGPILAKGTS
jgi:hypothetical protein